MTLRKASAYSKKRIMPFTRNSRAKAKAYIKVIPHSKIAKYTGGNHGASVDGTHKYAVKIVSEQKCLVRDNALESIRMLLTKMLDEKVPGQYYLKINVHPHHFLRENKTAAGAGADRISTGMTQAYGIVIGRAAIVGAGENLATVTCTDEKTARTIKDFMPSIKAKIPSKTKIVFQKLEMPAVAAQ